MPAVVHPLVEERLPELRELCARFRVRRLELFGSASSDRFDPSRSDLDFLVEFENLSGGYFDAYFGLLEALEDLFHRRVDLVMSRAVSNRYFLEGIRASRIVLYAA